MRPIAQRLSRVVRDERGYAIEYVLALLVIVLLMGAWGLAESLSARNLTTRDTRVRRAQTAADAGVQRMLYEEGETNIANWNMNGGPLQLSTTLDCVPVTLNASLQITGLTSTFVNNAGVCPSTSGTGAYTDSLGNHGFEQAEFIPGQANPASGAERIYWPKIVALGWDNNGNNKVYSRQEVILQPVAPLQAVEGMGNVTVNGLSTFGIASAAVVNGDIVARGTVTLPSVYAGVQLATGLSGNVNATVSAPTISGSSVTNVTLNTTSKSNIPLRQTISVSSSKASCPTAGCAGITYTNPQAGDGYNSATNTFSMTKSNTETATFSSGDYVFCNFNVTKGTVTASPTSSSAPVRIFIDSPTSSRCSGNGYTKTGGLWNGGNFNAGTGVTNTLSGLTAPSGLQIYVVGDGTYTNANTLTLGVTTTCKVSVLGVCTVANTPVTQMMVIYAPTASTTVDTHACVIAGVCAAGTFDGALVGDNVSITAGTITQDLDLGNYPLYDGVSVFKPSQFIECDASVTSLQGINDSTPTPSDVTHDTSGC